MLPMHLLIRELENEVTDPVPFIAYYMTLGSFNYTELAYSFIKWADILDSKFFFGSKFLWFYELFSHLGAT